MGATDKDVPITISASAFSRSASNRLRTLSCKASPKKVTPGFNIPPQIFEDEEESQPLLSLSSSIASGNGRRLSLFLVLIFAVLLLHSSDDEVAEEDTDDVDDALVNRGGIIGVFLFLLGDFVFAVADVEAAGCWHKGTDPFKMSGFNADDCTLRLHLQHVAHCKDP
mmetsp:Transcript_12997/g.20217  ORF Transcript_12997/g.20217 Transcript_12997/m.20217 type:complete len:167 (-) Transcript_12997:933-1433(-)